MASPLATSRTFVGDGHWPAVGLLTQENEAGEVVDSCTATLIQTAKASVRNVLLTAKHCGNQKTNFYLGTGVSRDFGELTRKILLCDGNMTLYTVTPGAVVPIGNGSWGGHTSDADFNDIQLEFLEYSVPGVDPLFLQPLATNSPSSAAPLTVPQVAPGQTWRNMTVVGFGLQFTSGQGATGGVKQFFPISIGSQNTANKWYQVFGPEMSDITTSPGDSGAPLLGNAANLGLRIFGVVSGTTAKKDNYKEQFARLDAPNILGLINAELAPWQSAPRAYGKGVTCASLAAATTDAGAPPNDPRPLGIH